MINFEDLSDTTYDTTLDDLAVERSQFQEERGTTMDIIHDLWAGSGQALGLLGSATGSETLKDTAGAIAGSSFAMPDTSQYYGTQDRLGRVIDGIATSLPTSLAIGGTAVAGGLLAGPVGAGAGFTAAMGALGKGTFEQAMEEVRTQRPDLSPEEQFKYGTTVAVSEVGSEALGWLVPFGLGKMLSKPASKAVMGALLSSGRITTEGAVGAIVKNAGGRQVVEGLFGGAIADGASEVVNELIQASARDAAGLEENPVDLIDIFLIGSGPGAAIGGITTALDSKSNLMKRKSLETALNSDDLQTRVDAVDIITEGLNKLDPELGAAFNQTVSESVLQGPLDLNQVTELKKEEDSVLREITENPEAILTEKGIPLGTAEEADRAALEATPEVYEETRVLDEVTDFETPEPVVSQEVQNYMSIAKPEVPEVGTEEYDTAIRENDNLTAALKLNDSRSKAIKAGMERVLVDSNKLALEEDLDAREVLEKRIEKTKVQIAKEASKVAPVTPKAVPVAPKAKETVAVPKKAPVAKPVVTPKVSEVKSTISDKVVAPKVAEIKAPATAPKIAKAVVPTAPAETVKLDNYKDQLTAVKGLDDRLQRLQATKGTPEVVAQAKQDAKILAPIVQAARKHLQSLPKPPAKAEVFKSKKEAKAAVADNKLSAEQVAKAQEVQDLGISISPEIQGLLVKHKGTATEFKKSLETPQQVKASGIGQGRTISFHEGTELKYMGDKTEAPKRWLVRQGSLTKRAASEPAARKAIADGTVADLKDYEDVGKVSKGLKDLPKLSKEQKSAVETFMRNQDPKEFGRPSDVTLAAASLASQDKLYVDGTLQKEALKKEAKSWKNVDEGSESEAKASAKTGKKSGVTAEIELSTEQDIVIPKTLTKAEEKVEAEKRATERSKEKQALDAAVVTVEATDDLKAMYLARHLAAQEKLKKSGMSKGEYIGREKIGVTLEERTKAILDGPQSMVGNDQALREEELFLQWQKNVHFKMSRAEVSAIYDKYVKPYDGNVLVAYLEFDKVYYNTRDAELQRVGMQLRYDALQNKDVAETYFTSKYKNAAELLDGVIEHGSEQEVILARFIKGSPKIDKLKGIPIIIDTGSYFTDREGGQIAISKSAILKPYLWLHELQHAVTSQEIVNNEKMRKEVGVMMNDIRTSSGLTPNQLAIIDSAEGNATVFNDIPNKLDNFTHKELEVAYALVNEREFLAQAYSSGAVRDLMRNTEHTGAIDKSMSVWQRIKDFFMEIMDLPKEYDSVLEATMRVSARLYRTSTLGVEVFDSALSVSRSKETLDEATRTVLAEKKATNKYEDKAKEVGAATLSTFKKVAEPLSDRLKRLSEPIYAKLMGMEARQMLKGTEYSKGVKPFLRYYEGLTESQKVRLDIGLMNNNKDVWNEMPNDVRVSLEAVLNDGAKRSIDVGLLVKQKDLYFPRRVKDIVGLSDYLMKDLDVKGPLGMALNAKAQELGMEITDLPQAIRNQVVTDMLASGQIQQLPKPGSSKQRSIGKVTSDIVPFYASASESLVAHIYELNDKVSLREFVGGSGRKAKISALMSLNTKIDKETDVDKKQILMNQWEADARALQDLEADLDDGIQSLIDKHLSTADGAVQTEVLSMLSARMRQRGATGLVSTLRNIGYAAVMGNFMSAITQLGDIPIIFYRYGVTKDSFSSIGEAFKAVFQLAKSEVTGKGTSDAFVFEMDFTNALREFSTGSDWSGKALDTIFKYSGLKYADLIGKETALRASFKFYQKPANKKVFMDKFENFFPDAEAVLRKIQMGQRTDPDVLTALFAELSDFQPVSLSQSSEVYLGAGNARMFYSLKSFNLRTTSAAIREATESFKKGGKKNIAIGVMKLTSIALLYAAAGAGADELKDLISGKESTITDNMTDNLLQMVFLSRYSIEQGMQKDTLLQGIINGMVPPVRYADNMIADVAGLISDDKEFKFKSLALVPGIGNILQKRSAPQQASYASQERKAILEDVKANKKSRKGARDGGITDRVREYNRKVTDKKLKITDSSIMSAYKS